MNRRKALILLSTLGVTPLTAVAQQAGKVWRVGILRPGPDDAIWRENFAPFQQTMRELGYVEGRNLVLAYRVRPGSPEEILALAKELVHLKVDAIVAISAAGVAAAARATASIPIVANDNESDPVARGYAASLARPGRNITGQFLDFPEIGGKWIEMLGEVVPKLSRIAVLWDPVIGPYFVKEVAAAASSLRVQTVGLEARGLADLEGAFQAALKQGAQALLVLTSVALNTARTEIAALALKHRLPSIMSFSGFADAGGLMAFGPSLFNMFRQSAASVAKILQGARPGELPIERPTRFDLIINKRTANSLGITIPPLLLLRAERIIE